MTKKLHIRANAASNGHENFCRSEINGKVAYYHGSKIEITNKTVYVDNQKVCFFDPRRISGNKIPQNLKQSLDKPFSNSR